MADWIQIKASDGHTFDCYRAMPNGTPKGGLLVIQEIFGVNSHIRGVTEHFASHGYAAYAPALYDRAEKNFEVGYTPEDIQKGRDMRGHIGWDDAVKDMAATVEALRQHGKVGAVGYCWGGSLAWLTATRIGVDASICYYGGQIAQFRSEKPKNPVMMHFGELDHAIPMDDVEAIRTEHPDIPVHIYKAGHGFNCDQRGDYDAESAKLALQRTLDFLAKNVG